MSFGFCLALLASALHGAPTSVLVWSDEFDKPGLPDSTRWTFETGGDGGGNKESQFYTNRRPSNAWVSDGLLRITARREDTANCWYGPCKFTSARLVSRGKAEWLYGKIEVRAKLTRGVGLWPAIWMLGATSAYGGWPAEGEIDIMESVGFDSTTVFGTIHTDAYNHVKETAKGSTTKSTSLADSFHVYSLDWRPDSLFIGFDGKNYFKFKNEGNWQAWPFDKPQYMILNVAVGGEWGGQKGVDTSVFPQTMEVDWVHVSKVATSPGPFTVQARTSQGGHVQIQPSKPSYDPLEKVVLLATPDSGWTFSAWDSGSSSRTGTDTVLIDRDLVVRAIFLPAGEQISNSDFTKGLGGWSHWNDEALASTWVARDGMACIRPGGRDSANSWKAQFDWSGLSVIPNELYDLTFIAKSTVPRKVSIGIVQDYDPNGGLSAAWNQTITPNPARFSHTFKITKSGAPARLEFDIAGDTAEICLDSVSLRKNSGQTAIAPRTDPSISLDVHSVGRDFVIRSPELPLASWDILRRDGSVVRSGKFDAAGTAQLERLPKGILLFSATSHDGQVVQKSLLVM